MSHPSASTAAALKRSVRQRGWVWALSVALLLTQLLLALHQLGHLAEADHDDGAVCELCTIAASIHAVLPPQPPAAVAAPVLVAEAMPVPVPASRTHARPRQRAPPPGLRRLS